MGGASRRRLSRRSKGLKPRAASTTPTTSDRIASLIRTRAGFPPKNRSINGLLFRKAAGGEPHGDRTLGLEIKPELVRTESRVKENLNDVSASASLALDMPQSALPEPWLVPRAGLAPACLSARTALKGLPTPRRASHCAHRRRQDARQFPAEPYRSRAPWR